MEGTMTIALVAAIGLGLYLVMALLVPEKFS